MELNPNIPVNDKLRSIIFEAYNGRCQYCVDDIRLDRDSSHVDHIIPKAISDNDLENIVMFIDWAEGNIDRRCLDHVLNYTLACSVHNLRKSGGLLSLPAIALLLMRAKQKAPEILVKYYKKSDRPRSKRVSTKRLKDEEEEMWISEILEYIGYKTGSRDYLAKRSRLRGIKTNFERYSFPEFQGRDFDIYYKILKRSEKRPIKMTYDCGNLTPSLRRDEPIERFQDLLMEYFIGTVNSNFPQYNLTENRYATKEGIREAEMKFETRRNLAGVPEIIEINYLAFPTEIHSEIINL